VPVHFIKLQVDEKKNNAMKNVLLQISMSFYSWWAKKSLQANAKIHVHYFNNYHTV